jgi:hypothetical protein
MGCPDAILQAENNPLETANLYATNYCNGTPVNEICGPLAVSNIQGFSAMIYPNPANDIVSVMPSIEGTYSVEVFDFSGRRLMTSTKDFGITELNIENLPAGTYLVRISSGNQSLTEKLVKF